MEELIKLLVATTGTVFIKQGRYSVAKIGPVGDGNKDKRDEVFWREYLTDEVKMHSDCYADNFCLSMFIGDADFHSWIAHYHVRWSSARSEFLWDRIR